MNQIDSQIRAKMDEFHSALTNIAWGIADYVISEQRKKLADGLTNLYIKASKPRRPKKEATNPVPTKAEIPTLTAWKAKKMAFIENRSGTWDRGSGPYKIVGPGQKIGTYELVNNSGKKIISTVTTLLSRWKHTP